MDLRLGLAGSRQIFAIEAGLGDRHVVSHDLKQNAKLADHDLSSALPLPEECQVLPDSNTIYICQLADQVSKVKCSLSQQSCLAVAVLRLIKYNERREMQNWALSKLSICDWKVESIGGKNRVRHSC